MKLPASLALLVVGAVLGGMGVRWFLLGPAAEPAVIARATPATPVAPPASDGRVQVEVVPVAVLPVARGVSAVGNLRSQDSVILRSEIAGRISEIGFVEGGRVEKGQTLVRLDDAVTKAELQQAQANLSLARSQYKRAQELSAQGFISHQARDEAASQLQIQQATVALAQARLDKTVIAAPFDGLIGLRNLSVGDYVSAGDELVPLESIDPLNVDFRIPEQYLAQVAVGATLAVHFDALPGLARQGEVKAMSPLVDVGGRSILLRASIPNTDGVLRPGMFARVQLRFSDGQSMLIPEAALAPSGRAQYVFRVDDGKAQRLEVQIGQRRDGWVEILSGLQPDARVVVSGLQKIRDGSEVNASVARILPPPMEASVAQTF